MSYWVLVGLIIPSLSLARKTLDQVDEAGTYLRTDGIPDWINECSDARDPGINTNITDGFEEAVKHVERFHTTALLAVIFMSLSIGWCLWLNVMFMTGWCVPPQEEEGKDDYKKVDNDFAEEARKAEENLP